jgi:hypothetical protein
MSSSGVQHEKGQILDVVFLYTSLLMLSYGRFGGLPPGRFSGHWGYPWPIWVMLGWGIGIAFQYFDAYHGSKQELEQQEYEKLKREKGL